MNQGIFGFPTTLSGNILSITEFDASGTYTIPDDMTSLEILLVGGGGGGGSGGRTVGTTTTSGGGGGGSGGGMVHHVFYKNDLRYIKNLIITIGLGGNGGAARSEAITTTTSGGGAGSAGQAGGHSEVRSVNGELSLLAPGGGIGAAGGALTTNSTTIAPRRNFLIMDLPRAMGDAGAMGEISSTGNHIVRYRNFSWSGGGGGGSAQTATTTISGGSIVFYTVNTDVSSISFGGVTAAFGGTPNLGATLGKGEDGIVLYSNGAGSQYFCGFGGAGGGAANSVGGGNGGDGYRGGGGGGGGGVRLASGPLSLGAVPSGAGGRGGNGYCRIIARK